MTNKPPPSNFDIGEEDYVAAVAAVPAGPVGFQAAAWRREASGEWVCRWMTKEEVSDVPFSSRNRRWLNEVAVRNETEAIDACRDAWKAFLAVAREDPALRPLVKRHHGFRLMRERGGVAAMAAWASIPGISFNFMDLATGQVGSADTPEQVREVLGD